MSKKTTTVVAVLAVLGAGYYFWQKQNGKSIWSNASGKGNSPASRKRCAIYANPNGTYSHTGAGQTPQAGATCVASYA